MADKNKPKEGKGGGAAPAATAPAAATKKEKITEKLPDKLMSALKDEGYKLEQVLNVRSYSEQKLWRAVTTDGQRHEISFAGKFLSETPSERKKRVAAEAKKKPAKK